MKYCHDLDVLNLWWFEHEVCTVLLSKSCLNQIYLDVEIATMCPMHSQGITFF